MIANGENNAENVFPVTNFVTAAKIVILAVFLVPIARYTFLSKDENPPQTVENHIDENNNVVEQNSTPVERRERKIIIQPSCSSDFRLLLVLQDICNWLVEKNTKCSPEDVHDKRKHRIPRRGNVKNQSSKDTGGEVPAIINYAVGLVLTTSLVAALIEFYKARKQPCSKTDGKPSLSRKCSLADLTVLKHHRKELMRRESLMEVLPEEHKGFQRPPLYRRCSFPVGGATSSPLPEYGLVDLTPAARRMSIIDSRRTSIVPFPDRRISVSEDSPERRHHSRLVHRH